MENITIYTSVYPTEYIANRLYGEHSTILSIYPDGVIPSHYSLNDKQIKDYSRANLFIFDGISNEKNYLKSMLKYNKDLKIIDATSNMEFTDYEEELWLDPANYLMLARNIKVGFNEYIVNHYLKSEIEKNYESLKLDLSTLDAKLSVVSNSSNDPTIVVSSNMFKFLEKYGFNVISLDERSINDKTIYEVTSLINEGRIQYIFVINNSEINESIQKIIDETGVKTLRLNSLSNLSDSERNNKSDYLSIMNENINLLKQELYD